jgi:predicted TIM-barrel fold metal-dependent hydrolase
MPPTLPPHNRLNLNYHDIPKRKLIIENGIIDAHNHTREPHLTQTMIDAANAYGISEFYTMAPLEHVKDLQQKFPNKFHFIAVPKWSTGKIDDESLKDWTRRIDAFYELGARLIKFHAAPGTARRWAANLDDPRIQQLAKHAYDLGYHFMSHVGDPRAWYFGAGKYADNTYGTPDSQFDQLDRMLEKYPDRIHLGAHMGGSLENLDLLAKRLEKFPHYIIDTSATKWIVRAIAEQPVNDVRDFILNFQDRIVFGSDLVVGEKYDWDHYASRYWTHQMLWETDYRDQSPIEDPDAGAGFNPKSNTFNTNKADGLPRLTGLNLPAPVLQKLYRQNADRLLPK